MRKLIFPVLVMFLMVSFPCYGQMIPSMVTSSMRRLPNGEVEIRATYKMEPGPIPAFLDDPYSVKRLFQKNIVLADGTNIERQASPVLHYQDSLGRFRAEYPFRRPANFPNQIDLPYQVEIIDSVAGYHYILDTVHRIAHRGVIEIMTRRPLPPRPPDAPSSPAIPTTGSGGSTRPQRTTEALGSKVIEDSQLEGTRTTTIYPAGSSMGNDRPVAVTSEEWRTPGSSMPPFKKTIDPSSGQETAASYDIERGEPDPGLFQIPADYKIVDEPGPFAVTFIFSRDTMRLR